MSSNKEDLKIPEFASTTRPDPENYLNLPIIDDMRDNKFSIVISNEDNTDQITYPIIDITPPSISCVPISAPFQLHDTKVPSNTLHYSDASFSFIMNTEMTLFYYIFRSMTNNTTNHTYSRDIDKKYMPGEDKKATLLDRRRQISILIYDNNNNVIRTLEMKNCFFNELGNFTFKVTAENTNVLVCTATFSLDYMDFE